MYVIRQYTDGLYINSVYKRTRHEQTGLCACDLLLELKVNRNMPTNPNQLDTSQSNVIFMSKTQRTHLCPVPQLKVLLVVQLNETL